MTGGTVVVLGTTGRNFGAGMSGGEAYVLDEDGAFARRCNMQMVELEAPAAEDVERLRAIVAEHVALTRSAKGARLLREWERTATRFVKVMPTEYKKVLAARVAEQAVS
jgi:glutamate synthase domain-containing protein 3